jgi:tetratricopeptide (TPR) repeat protein
LCGDTFQVIRAAYDGLKTPVQRQQYRRQLYGETLDDPLAEGNAVLQAEVHFQEGQQLLTRREWDRAAELLAKAWELNPKEGEYALALGTVRARQTEAGRPHLEREAEALLRRAHGMLENSAEPAYQMGRLALRRGDADTAVSQFRLALSRDPKHLAAQREFRLLRMRQPAGGGRLGDLLSRRSKG